MGTPCVAEEYNDTELHRLVEVAMANTSLEDVPRLQPRLLRGLTADTTNDWVTMGFPDLPQQLAKGAEMRPCSIT